MLVTPPLQLHARIIRSAFIRWGNRYRTRQVEISSGPVRHKTLFLPLWEAKTIARAVPGSLYGPQ